MKRLTITLLTLLVLGGCASSIPFDPKYGWIYEGETKDDLRHGQGEAYLPDRSRTVSGEWVEGQLVYGKSISDDCEYTGEWSNGTYHGRGTYINRGVGCRGYYGNWKFVGEFDSGAFTNGALVIDDVPPPNQYLSHNKGDVFEGKMYFKPNGLYLHVGTEYKASGEVVEHRNESSLLPLIKRDYKEPFGLDDLVLFPIKVALGTVLVAGEIASSPAGQAALANQQAKNQKKREEAIYQQGKRDGERRARKTSNQKPRLPQP